MSTHYRLLKKVPASDLFDGRLEEFGVREHVVPKRRPERVDCLLTVATTCGFTLMMTALSAA